MDFYKRAGGIEDKGPAIIGASVSLMSFGLILVATRLTYRIRTSSVGTDDILITCAILLSLGHSINDCLSVRNYGFGRHKYDLNPEQIIAGKSTGAGLGFFIAQIFYKLSLACTKLSICFLYRRIFEKTRPFFNIALWLITSLIAAYYFAAVMATIFTCIPVQKSWYKKMDGKCINTNAFFFANAAFNIASDIMVMLLPVPIIRSLHLPTKQRVMLGLVFCVGIFATVTSIIRIFTLNTATKNTDTTWEVAGSTMWSAIEINTAIICACLPMLRLPLQALFPQLFKSCSGRSHINSGAALPYNRSTASAGIGGSRFSKQFAKSQGIELENGVRTIEIGHEKDSDGHWHGRDDDQTGILKQTDFSVVYEDDRESDGESKKTDPGMRTLGMAL